jgi:uncharacterized protein (TIGR03083 family)
MILEWTRQERISIADLFDSLTDEQWRTPSLCAGWTVLHVAAHLTTQTRATWRGMATGMIRARGDWNRMEVDMAERIVARHSKDEIIAMLRETAGSPRRAPGAALLDPLLDTIVHGQDVARPLGIARPMPVEQTVAALEHARTSRFYGARKRFADTRLIATDCDWSAGDGTRELRGPVGDLLLVATGRPAGLAALSGDAVDHLAAAL